MKDTPPEYWKNHAGDIYRLVMLAGYDVDGDPNKHVSLYVCESVDGLLNEAFQIGDPGWNVTSDYTPDRRRERPSTVPELNTGEPS